MPVSDRIGHGLGVAETGASRYVGGEIEKNHLVLLTKAGDVPEGDAIPPGATLFFMLPEEKDEPKMVPMVLVKVTRTSLTFRLDGHDYVFAVTGVPGKELKRRRRK